MNLSDCVVKAEFCMFSLTNDLQRPRSRKVFGIEVLLSQEPTQDLLKKIANDFAQYLPNENISQKIEIKDLKLDITHPFNSCSIYLWDTEVYRAIPVFNRHQLSIHQIPKTKFSRYI